MHVCSKRNQSNEGVVRHEVETLLQRVLELVEILVLHARVDYKQKDGLASFFIRELVLERSVGRYEFGRKVLLAYAVRVVGRKVVSRETEGARPQFAVKVNLAVRVQHTPSALAPNRLIF